MSSLFCGIVIFDGAPVSRAQEDLLALLIRRHRPHRVEIRRTSRATFVMTDAEVTQRDTTLFAASSRLDNRAEIVAATGLDPNASESEGIRCIFEARGDAGIAQILGAFAFAHWDEKTATLTLARDDIGRRSLFYHLGRGFAVFASHLADLLAVADVPRELDERMIANFLALNHLETETTFYRRILRVPTRSVARISPAGAEWHRYWSPRLDVPPPYRRDEDYIARARELFDRAVVRALRDTPRAAIQLSGGLDSSAIAATASRLGLGEIAGYSCLPPAALDRPPRPGWYLDERPKIEALMRIYPELRVNFIAPHGAHWRQSDPARFFPEIPLAIRGISNLGWFAQIDDAIAADRHTVVLHGAMGNMTTSWDGRFSLVDLLRQGRFLRASKEAYALARATGRSLPGAAMGQGLMPFLPPAVQRVVARLRGKAMDDVSGFSLLEPTIIDELGLRQQWRADGYDPTFRIQGTSARLRATMIYDMFQIGRDFAGMRVAAGHFDNRSPFVDRDLIAFCLSVPELLYRREGVSRWFARAVFADRLPREIIDETKTGEQAPNWFEALDARKAIIADELERLEASRLAARLIDLPRAKRLITDWPKDASEAQGRMNEYRYALDRAIHVGAFIRWVEGGNA